MNAAHASHSAQTPSLVLIGPSSEKYKGGIAQFTRMLADTMQKYRPTHFISWYQIYPPFLLSRDFEDKVSSKGVGTSDAEYLLGYMNPLSWWRAAKRIREINPEWVYLTWIHPVHVPVYLPFVLYLKAFTSAKIAFICHNVLPHERFPGATLLAKLVLGMADELIVHGRSEAKDAERFVSSTKVRRLFLPLFNFFGSPIKKEERSSDSSTLHLLFFGNIRHYKGVDLLLQAFSQLIKKYPFLRLTIAGEKFYEKDNVEDPLRLISELDLSEFVTQDIRYIPNEDIPRLFAQADLAMFPFRSASQSASLTTAYSFHVPVVASRVGGLPDAVVEGESGYLCEPDADSIALAVERFIERPISAEQVEAAVARFSWDSYVQGLLEQKTKASHQDRRMMNA